MSQISKAMQDVIDERNRQVSVEGWTAEHDDKHANYQLSTAAGCYALHAAGFTIAPRLWPWDAEWWKPKDRRRDLVRAAALIVAEIERLDRKA